MSTSLPASPLPSTRDVADGIGKLDPTDTALFILVVVILALLAERIIAGWRMAQERKAMADISKEFAASAREFSSSTGAIVTKIEVLSHLAARLEVVAPPADRPHAGS